MKVRRFIGRGLLRFVAIFTTIGTFHFDWNATHIYNPTWPPHAKYHNGQTMMMAVLLSLLALYFLHTKGADGEPRVRLAALFASLYWVSQAGAIFFPGAAFYDPDQGPPASHHIAGLPAQVFLQLFMGALIVTALLLNRKPSR